MKYNPENYKGLNLGNFRLPDAMSTCIDKTPYGSEYVLPFLQDETARLVRGESGSKIGKIVDSFSPENAQVFHGDDSKIFVFVVSGELIRSRELEDWRAYLTELKKSAKEIDVCARENLWYPTAENFEHLGRRGF